jgi:hypothetical protein
MKYWLVVANPVDRGVGNDNSRLSSPDNVEQEVAQLAGQFPGEKIVVMKPVAMYTTKVAVTTTQFSINDKGEVLPT